MNVLLKKKLIPLILMICLVLASLPFLTQNTYAAIKPYSTLNLSTYDFDIVASGTISAVKVSGVWCYKFVKNGKAVYIKASAFSNSSIDNSTAYVNQSLTNQINKFNSSYGATYLYKEKLKNAIDPYAGKCTVHRWSINKYRVSEESTSYDLTLKCEVIDGVYFTYNTKVKRLYENGRLVTPFTANDYKIALKRSHTTSYNSSKKPVFNVNIVKPGNNKTYMSQYNMTGKGTWQVKTKSEWGDYVKVAFSIGNVVKSSITGGPLSGLKSALGVAYNTSNPRYASGVYSSNGEYYLSNDNKKKYCLKSTFESPVIIKTKGTYFRTKIFFAKPISKVYVKTERSISFSLK